jgi:uncharacterized coiled-coil DUF342 family protein
MNIIIDKIVEHWEFLAAPIAWLLGREQRKVSAAEGIKALYEGFVEDYRKKYDEMHDDVESLRTEVDQLRKENLQLKKEIQSWINKYNNLEKKNK